MNKQTYEEKVIERYSKLKPDFIDNPLFQETVNKVEEQLFEEFKNGDTQTAINAHLEVKALHKVLSRFVSIANEYKILTNNQTGE